MPDSLDVLVDVLNEIVDELPGEDARERLYRKIAEFEDAAREETEDGAGDAST